MAEAEHPTGTTGARTEVNPNIIRTTHAADKVRLIRPTNTASTVTKGNDSSSSNYFTTEGVMKHSKIVRDNDEARAMADVSNSARSREALERQTRKTQESVLDIKDLPDREKVILDEFEKLKELDSKSKDYKIKFDLMVAHVIRFAKAKEDADSGILSPKELESVYPDETTDKAGYDYYSPDQKHELDEAKFAEIAERQEKWAQALHRTPEAQEEWSVKRLMKQEDEVLSSRNELKKIEEFSRELMEADKQKKLNALTGMTQLERLLDGEETKRVREEVSKALTENKSEPIQKVYDAFFTAVNTEINRRRDLANQKEEPLMDLLRRAGMLDAETATPSPSLTKPQE